jgi:D-3-phosphoglycerate dehydrogenase / 2-oxoglutarate reductase
MVARGAIAVTPRSMSSGGHPALARLRNAGFDIVFPSPGRVPTPEEQFAAVRDCVGYLAGVEPIPADLMAACPRLRVISRNGAGTDAIDLDAAAERGVRVVTAVGANASGVAELTLGLMLSLARHIPWSTNTVKDGGWGRRRGIELSGRTLGVIGLGEIGQRVAVLGRGVGMRTLGHDPYQKEAAAVDEMREFADVLREADVVTLHRPPGGRPLIDRAALAKTRRGLLLINTARAGLIDDEALLDALKAGHVAGFATDVYGQEPPELTELLAHDRVIATPHIGGFTSESVLEAASVAVDNLLATLEGL